MNELSRRETEAILPVMLAVQVVLADWYLRAGYASRVECSMAVTHWLADGYERLASVTT